MKSKAMTILATTAACSNDNDNDPAATVDNNEAVPLSITASATHAAKKTGANIKYGCMRNAHYATASTGATFNPVTPADAIYLSIS